MKTFSKTLAAAAVASAVLAFPAHAAYITGFSGTLATQNDVDTAGGTNSEIKAGKTSSIVGVQAVGNYSTAGNVFVETFDWVKYRRAIPSDPVESVINLGFIKIVQDQATGNLNQFGLPGRPTDANQTEVTFQGVGGGFNTLNANMPNFVSGENIGGDLTISNGALPVAGPHGSGAGMAIRKCTTSYAAAPGGCVYKSSGLQDDPQTTDVDESKIIDPANSPNESYFAYGPGQGGALNAAVKIDYTNLLEEFGSGFGVGYLGVYYGSVDTYNEIRFYNALGSLISGSGLLSDGILKGTEILAALNGSSGNQTSDKSNVYLNLEFEAGDNFKSFEFFTSGIAVELDNVVTRVDYNVPEPGSMALAGLGLMGLAAMRRRKQQA